MLSDVKLIDRVVGEKKEMYLAILQHLANGFTEEETGMLFNLVKSRISQIYTANKQLCDELTLQAELAKTAGRLRYAFKKLRKKEANGSNKDSLDWLQYVKSETTQEKSLVDNSQHYYFTNLKGNALIDEARRRRIALPDEVARRLGADGVRKPD